MKFELRDIPADLLITAKEWREKMVEAAAEASEELMNKYSGRMALSEEEDQIAPFVCVRVLLLAKLFRCCVALPSRTRAFRRCLMR
jgi:translation elongation factor EF-G